MLKQKNKQEKINQLWLIFLILIWLKCEIKNIYNLKEEDINLLNDIRKEINDLNTNYKVLQDHTKFNNTFAFSKLEREIEDLKKRQVTEVLKDYDYAIMMSKDKTYPMIWNDGRWEQHVRTITFLSVPGSIPELTIKKQEEL